MKKYLMTGIAALTLCAGFTSCSHDFEPMTQEEIDKAKYDQAFLKYVGGKIAADQDWGFGSALTRAITSDGKYWDGDHGCTQTSLAWANKFGFTQPSGAKDLTTATFTDDERNYGVEDAVYIIPAGFEGELNLNGKIKFKKATIYNYGKVTGINTNFEGDPTTIYNAGTLTYNISSGKRHTVINTGTLTVTHYANIGDLYNSGTLVLGGATTTTEGEWTPELGYHTWQVTKVDVPNDMYIYSTGLVAMYDEGALLDLKAVCDIHNKLYVEGDLKIQNSTSKYICNIECIGKVENVDGPLYVSNLVANDLEFDGNNMYLTQGGHIKVTNTIKIYNSACHVYAVSGSNALVETTNFIFENDNDFDRTFSDNIYFKVDGYIHMSAVTDGAVKHENYENAAAYVAANGNPNSKLNDGTATGTPECGAAWTVGTPKQEVYDLRIIAEDLTVSGDNDFDFNDVVFDVKYGNPVKIKLLAAGGTLPLYVGGHEVHSEFGVEGTDVMINTNAGTYGTAADKAPVEFELTNVSVNSPEEANERIEIVVVKHINGQEVRETLKAEPGKPAAKIAVGIDYNWLDERVSIKEAYRSFTDWVNGTFKSAEWWK